MPACCIRRTSVAVLLLISGAVHADDVAPLPSFFGDMVADNGHITFEPGLATCESGGQCADISNVTDAANLAVDLAKQYTDTRINDVKEYVENYIDNSTSGVDQSYVDNADSKVLNDAKSYTDASSTADRAYTDNQSAQAEQRSQAYTDTVSTSDRAYTDSKIQKSEASTRTYIDESSENTYNRSVNYTDSKISEGNEYAITYSTSYTDNSSKKTLNQANNYTDNRFNQSINYTDNKISEVNNRVNHLSKKMDDNDRRAKAGIAGAMAMSAIPQRFDYDFNFGMGTATYGGEQALSAGSFYNVTSNTTLSAKVSLDTQHNVGGAVGFTVGW
ncbi:hypothetical protein FNZ18_20500 [Salmonella enterica subsp. salamae]|nr:hypothetical protein [Salmonella enterica subsp. salamae]